MKSEVVKWSMLEIYLFSRRYTLYYIFLACNRVYIFIGLNW